MTFVDTNVFIYAVGRPHPLRDPAVEFFLSAVASRVPLCTSSEVLQELLHVYLPANRLSTLDAALQLATEIVQESWGVEPADVIMARGLITTHPGLGARDLLHLACCRRRGVRRIQTFDRGLAAAFSAS